MDKNPLVTINLVVLNAERYVKLCLDAVAAQTYKNYELNILDNASKDSTVALIKKHGIKHKLILNEKNDGMWLGQEKLLSHSRGEIIVFLSVDVLLSADFLENAVKIMGSDETIGALQGKIYRWQIDNGRPEYTKIIDTCGFEIYKSREILNRGHGAEDRGQFNKQEEIFAVEGAVPVFRKKAIQDSLLDGHLIDPEYFWYGEDLDFAWRMRLMGWKEIYDPSVIAYHDRQTTKRTRSTLIDFIRMRKTIPIFKRRLDWRNTTVTVLKNDFGWNLLKDLPRILWRQIPLLGYFLIFETPVILEVFNVLKQLPKIFRQRREIAARRKVTMGDMRSWFK
ncbi:MAG: glycosyltransferase [Parcubacteria group bacterium Licking1014_17]|nr:MAG: glycosyltransferase [Parcubacteria group bacterium Licking1014_17]